MRPPCGPYPFYYFMATKPKSLIEKEIAKLAPPTIVPGDTIPWDVVNVVPVVVSEVRIKEDPEDGYPMRSEKFKKNSQSLSLRMYKSIFRDGKSVPREVVFSLDLPFRTDNCAASKAGFKSKDIIRTLMEFEGFEKDFKFIPIEDEQLKKEAEARKEHFVTSKLAELEAENRSNIRESAVWAKETSDFPQVAEPEMA